MADALDGLQRFGLKLFLAPDARIEPRELVPVFHRWIQSKAIDQRLIDVADYMHLPDGPRVLVVAHEGNFALDFTEGRPGLQYVRKQPTDGALPVRLTAAARLLLTAARLLERDDALTGRLRFQTHELQFMSNDRLRAPNDDVTAAAIMPALDLFLTTLFDGESYSVLRGGVPGDRLAMTATAPSARPLDTLLDRLV
jgi:hypothetical protein